MREDYSFWFTPEGKLMVKQGISIFDMFYSPLSLDEVLQLQEAVEHRLDKIISKEIDTSEDQS